MRREAWRPNLITRKRRPFGQLGQILIVAAKENPNWAKTLTSAHSVDTVGEAGIEPTHTKEQPRRLTTLSKFESEVLGKRKDWGIELGTSAKTKLHVSCPLSERMGLPNLRALFNTSLAAHIPTIRLVSRNMNHKSMAKKRKRNNGTPGTQRGSKRQHYTDDVDDDETGSAFKAARDYFDHSTGQRGAFPGLDDAGDDFLCGPASDGMD